MRRSVRSRGALLARIPRAALRAGVVLALAVAACERTPAPPRVSPVLLVSLDTLPASRVGCWGAPDVRTPELDRLARQGVQVRDAISPAPLTLPSHSTMLTGLNPPEHGVHENGIFVLDDAMVTVAERLPRAVRKAAFVGAFPVASRFGLAQGFDVYNEDFPERTGARLRHQPMRRARAVLDSTAAWLESPDSGEHPFVWAHLFDPHYPYESPIPWPRVAGSLGGGPYEGEVAYVDRELGRFLRRTGMWAADRRATIVIVGDHGESLGRHGEITHAIFIYDATQRVPLLMVAPGLAPRLDSAQRPLLDIAPTLLAAYDIDPPQEMAGVPLQRAALDDRDAYIETRHTDLLRGWSPLWGIRSGRWKYVRAPRPELYDLEADPGETSNVIGEHPEIATRLGAELDGILARGREANAQPMDPEVAEKLAALGYVTTPGEAAPGTPARDPKDMVEYAALEFRGEEAWMAGDLARAEWLLQRALRLDPDSKDTHSFLSGTYFGLGRYDLAIQHAERALELPPHLNDGPVYATLGEAQLVLGRREEALANLRRALALKPRDEKVQRLIRQAEGRAP